MDVLAIASASGKIKAYRGKCQTFPNKIWSLAKVRWVLALANAAVKQLFPKYGKIIAPQSAMHLSLITSALLTLAVFFTQVEYSQLIGSWQLTHFEGMEKIVHSSQYQNASPAQRASMEARIKYRLENTVYEFLEGEMLKFTDFENQGIVQKEAKVELSDGNMLLIHDEKGDRLAKIVEFSDQKMVLQPISKSTASGKLVFERIAK